MARLRLTASEPKAQERQGDGGPVQIPLSKLPTGSTAVVVSMDSKRGHRMARLSALGLLPGSQLQLLQRHPSLVVRIGETEVALETAVAREISVRVVE